MKNLRNLKGTYLLSKKEQQSINGGNNVSCRCLGGGGEGFVPNCDVCATLCAAIFEGYICVGPLE